MLQYCGIAPLSKTFIRITGKDSTKFLNGLTTSRLLPNIVKKKQHTITDSDSKHADLSKVIDIETNWGLMHEDIYDPEQNITISRDGINSMFLNSKGRVITDCFLYSHPFHNFEGQFDDEMKQPGFLVEVDNPNLLMVLKLHKLSAKIKIAHEKSLYSYYYYNDTASFDELLELVQDKYFRSTDPVNALQNANSFIKDEVFFNKDIAKHIIGFSFDNRIPNFGIKVTTNKPITKSEENEEGIPIKDFFSTEFQASYAVDAVPEDTVLQRRFVNGLFESHDAPKDVSLLPFECNLDYINGLSLEKGCYIGQELTIRTFNNGIIRKRIFPVQFFEINEENIEAIQQIDMTLDVTDSVISILKQLPPSTLGKLEITPLIEEALEEMPEQQQEAPNPFGASPFGSSKPVRKRKSSSGKIMTVQDNLGLALFGISDIEKCQLYKIEIPSLKDGNKVIGLKVNTPLWWPEQE